MAKAHLAEMKEKDLLTKEFDTVLIKSSKEYAKEAALMCMEIGNIHRAEAIKNRFLINF